MALDKKMKIEFSSVLTDLVSVNESFDSAVLNIAYTGKNRNGSFISKKSFENAIPTMFGCPVVANYIREIEEIGSHDGEIIETSDGDIKYVNITQPVGFIPPGANWWWTEEDVNGVIKQCLNTEVVLWKRQEAYDKIKENGITKQSMEITVNEAEMKDDYYEITDFIFTAFCLLGTAEPCFENASLTVFSYNKEMEEQLSTMYEEFKAAFAVNSVAKEDVLKVDKLKELLEKYNFTIEDIDFEYEQLSDEELEQKFEELKQRKDAGQDDVIIEDEPVEEPVVEEPATEEPVDDEPVDEPVDEPETDSEGIDDAEVVIEETTEETPADDTPDTYALNSALTSSIREALSLITTEYNGYKYLRYFLVDYDVESCEVYYEDSEDGWKLYGSPYTQDGDAVVIDFACKKRKKYSIVDYVEGTSTFTHKEIIDGIIDSANEKYEALNEKYNELVEKCHLESAQELCEQFEAELGDMEEFKSLRDDAINYSLDELNEKLFALVGKKTYKFEKSNKAQSPKAPVIRENTEESPYGDYFNFLERNN